MNFPTVSVNRESVGTGHCSLTKKRSDSKGSFLSFVRLAAMPSGFGDYGRPFLTISTILITLLYKVELSDYSSTITTAATCEMPV